MLIGLLVFSKEMILTILNFLVAWELSETKEIASTQAAVPTLSNSEVGNRSFV